MTERKKVIFVGGTSYSGSTFFHMILGNDPAGFAGGELRWLFNPTRPHHANRPCSCGDASCGLWRSVRSQPLGEHGLFRTIFDLRPFKTFVVDSSKSVFWMARQSKLLVDAGITVKHILIWKSPKEFHGSMERRGRGREWKRVWTNYHLLYFSLIPEWRAVPYSDLVLDRNVLPAACQWLAIPHYQGKEEYWRITQHIFGGSRTARFHLYKGEDAEKHVENSVSGDGMQRHRRIYHSTDALDDATLPNGVSPRQTARLRRIMDALVSHDVRTSTPDDIAVPTMPAPAILARRAKNYARHTYGRYKYGSG